MSILTIGERSIYNYQSPYFSNNYDEVNVARRQKKAKQEQYRLELIAQMNQKYQRRKIRQQESLRYNRRHERVRTQLPYEGQSRLSYLPQDNHYPYSLQKLRRRYPQYYQHFPSSYSYAQSPSNQFQRVSSKKYGSNRLEQRIKTEGASNNDKFEDIIVDLEKRRQQLNHYDDKKIEEVYQKMYDSVIRLKNQNNSGIAESSSFRYPKVSDLYTQNSVNSANNPEEDHHFSLNKLPPLFKNRQSKTIEDSQRDWKEWYARQKLRELQSYYKKIANGTPRELQGMLRMNGGQGNQYSKY